MQIQKYKIFLSVFLFFILLIVSCDCRSHSITALSRINEKNKIDSNKIVVQANKITQCRGGESESMRSEFIFGKDREMFHASIDLKWLYKTITNKEFWKKLGIFAVEIIKRQLNQSYNAEIQYRENSKLIFSMLLYIDPNNNLKLFQSSLKTALNFARRKSRLILYYCRDKDSTLESSQETFLSLKLLSQRKLSSLINDKFIFLANTKDHLYTQDLINLHKIQTENGAQDLNAPFLIVLAPIGKDEEEPSLQRLISQKNYMTKIRVIDTLSLTTLSSLDENQIYKFLTDCLKTDLSSLISFEEPDIIELTEENNDDSEDLDND